MSKITVFAGWDKDLKEVHVTVDATEAPAEYIQAKLTDEDIEAWHNGEVTAHVKQLMSEAGVETIQIWGSNTGTEPLSVNIG